MTQASTQFDFDAWKDLAAHDPLEFENRRRALIEAEIEAAPQDIQARLRGLQWQVDMIRRRYKHPSVSTAKLFEMMWNKVYGADGLLEALSGDHSAADIAAALPPAAKVLKFQVQSASR